MKRKKSFYMPDKCEYVIWMCCHGNVLRDQTKLIIHNVVDNALVKSMSYTGQ